MSALTEHQIAQVEQHIAFEGTVTFDKWIDTSAHGFKITLGLQSRADLDAFDGVMTYRKKRGGQRYMAICQPHWQPDGPGTPLKPDASQQFIDEWHFAGRGWNESSGAHIAVMVGDSSSIASWKLRTAGDQLTDDSGPRKYYVMLLELNDDEQIINQEKRTRVVAPPPPKGGPRSKAVARLIQDLDFRQWLNWDSIHNVGPQGDRDAKGRDAYVKQIIGIASKVELDNGNEDAWRKWEIQFKTPFLKWTQRR